MSATSPTQEAVCQGSSTPNPPLALASVLTMRPQYHRLLLIPAFIIRPFRHQAPSALMLAPWRLRQRAPLGTLIAAFVCFLSPSRCGEPPAAGARLSGVDSAPVVTFSAVMARLNYFEWMFHPLADRGNSNRPSSRSSTPKK